MASPLVQPPNPGLYPGTGLATLLNTNTQVFLFVNQPIAAGSPGVSSIAVQLERQKSSSYPFGFAIEILFSGAPGTFEVDVQGAEQDQNISYCLLGTKITTVNGSNVARFEGVSLYPKFVRVNVPTMGNAVNMTALITR